MAIVFGGVPALLLAMATVSGSETWRLSLVVESVVATPWTAFAANYVHDDPAHLVGNVLVFWVAVGILYPLTTIAGWRRRWLLAVAGLGVVPWVVTATTLFFAGGSSTETVAGFSGIDAFLFGVTVPAWFAAWNASSDDGVRKRSGGRVQVRVTWSIAVPAGLLAVVFANPGDVLPTGTSPLAAIGAGAIAVAALVGFVATTDRRALETFRAGDEGRFLVAGGGVAALAILGTAFGATQRWATIWHLTGFVAGFLGAYVPAIVAGWVRRRRA